MCLGDRLIPAASVIWAAGVTVPNLKDWLLALTDRTGRVAVEPDLLNVIAFLSELGMAAAFILGFGVRAFALLGMVFAAQLYFGLYTHPSEWPWEFIFIIVICWLFLINAAGRSLGLDAILRRLPAVLKSDSLIARLYRLAS